MKHYVEILLILPVTSTSRRCEMNGSLRRYYMSRAGHPDTGDHVDAEGIESTCTNPGVNRVVSPLGHVAKRFSRTDRKTKKVTEIAGSIFAHCRLRFGNGGGSAEHIYVSSRSSVGQSGDECASANPSLEGRPKRVRGAVWERCRIDPRRTLQASPSPLSLSCCKPNTCVRFPASHFCSKLRGATQ